MKSDYSASVCWCFEIRTFNVTMNEANSLRCLNCSIWTFYFMNFEMNSPSPCLVVEGDSTPSLLWYDHSLVAGFLWVSGHSLYGLWLRLDSFTQRCGESDCIVPQFKLDMLSLLQLTGDLLNYCFSLPKKCFGCFRSFRLLLCFSCLRGNRPLTYKHCKGMRPTLAAEKGAASRKVNVKLL